MAKPYLLLSALILFALGAGSATGIVPQDAKGAKPAASDTKVRGKRLYSQDCSMCHGDNGNGQTDLAKDMQLKILDWTDPKALGDKSDQELFDLIRKGKDKMPPEDSGRAKDDEIKGVIQYIREFSKGQPTPAAPAAPAAATAPAAPTDSPNK